MSTHQTKITVLPADPGRDVVYDVRDHATDAEAIASYCARVKVAHDLPATGDGDLMCADLILDGEVYRRRWYLAGDDYLLPLTDDQLMTHLGEQLASEAADYLYAELGPGASH